MKTLTAEQERDRNERLAEASRPKTTIIHIVEKTDRFEFVAEVNAMLLAGWLMLGTPTIHKTPYAAGNSYGFKTTTVSYYTQVFHKIVPV